MKGNLDKDFKMELVKAKQLIENKKKNNESLILDVGAGPNKYPGSISIDFNPKTPADIVWDLNNYPWPLPDSEFDLVYSSHCLEHLYNPIQAIEEIHRILKPKGRFILKVPHFSSHVAWWTPEHKRTFTIGLFHHFDKNVITTSSTKYFKVLKIRLNWFLGPKKLILKLFNKIITFLANLNIVFCERIWCYWVVDLMRYILK
jgi:SAM-dependent methyltransferase